MNSPITLSPEAKAFRDGLFSLETRRFGAIGELIVSTLYDMSPSHTLEYDLMDGENRIECKFCRVFKKHPKAIRKDNLINEVLNARTEQRLISYYDKDAEWIVNFAQIKPRCFDKLYFGVFFSDGILVFNMTSEQVKELKKYSDKQHRGNKGEGQFGMSNRDLDEFYGKYHGTLYSYEVIYHLFKNDGKGNGVIS